MGCLNTVYLFDWHLLLSISEPVSKGFCRCQSTVVTVSNLNLFFLLIQEYLMLPDCTFWMQLESLYRNAILLFSEKRVFFPSEILFLGYSPLPIHRLSPQ